MKNKKGDMVENFVRYEISRILQECEILEIDHEPNEWPSIRMKDISALCHAVKGQVPVLDRLQNRLEVGCTIAKQDGEWNLFEQTGNMVCRGKTIREMLVNLIFIDC